MKFYRILIISLLIFVLIINIKPNIVYAVESTPLLGKLVKVVSIRNYFKLFNNEIDINKPQINYDENVDNLLNTDINGFIEKIMDKFYSEFNVENHNSIKVSYNVLTNNDKWFTMKINVLEISASSNYYYKIYHIDKIKNKIICLKDLFVNDGFKKIILDEIKRQMLIEMQRNESITYYLDSNFTNELNDNQNFYFNENNNIVIIYNKYEVSPGSIGTPQFEIDKKLYEKYLRKEYF